MTTPKVSVIMPAFNGESFIRRAIESVLRQTLQDWELVVVIDGPTDAMPQIVAGMADQDSRIRVFTQPNRGQSSARNRAVAESRSAMIAYLDYDDEYHPEYLASVAERAAADVIQVSCYEIFDERPMSGSFGELWVWNPGRRRHEFPRKNIFVPLGVAHHRHWHEDVGGFDESLRCDEDTDLWRRFAEAGAEVEYLDRLSGVYHLRAASQSRVRLEPSEPPQ